MERETMKEYQRRYYLEKVKKQKVKKFTFQIQKFIDGEWKVIYRL